ncbi:hypothetical protein BV210_05175 [Halorientalis sp. IM1011]|uniref:hypothetical protein n=1 Tax=Halorientalis sp. IM1011 TaxID=1932360 RepID=UPI00097CD667|nr:hypothetical protein [Halorientalis sp. IM1011]AQL42140.1 hypothetical protein BV210_05175 [Halorientalis sp. IM1011]
MTGSISQTQLDAAVIDANGQRIATVVRVEDGVPYVQPAETVDPTARRALHWDGDDPPHRLMLAHVESVTSDEIRLESNL